MAEINKPEEQDIIDTGSINISNEVVSIVASLAASSVKGVSGMVSSISGGFAELLGKKNMSKGVRVSVTEKNVSLDLSIIVEYGAKIPDVAWKIQEKVKSEVEAMTGLNVTAVNVSVEGVNVPKEDGDKTQTMGDIVEETASKASGFAEDVKDASADFAESFKETSVNFAADAKSKAKDFVSDAKKNVKDAADNASDMIDKAVEKAGDIAEDMSNKVEETVEDIKNISSDDSNAGLGAETE